MARKYQYESKQLPQGTGGATLTLLNEPSRFLPGGLSLSVTGLTAGSYTILLQIGPLGSAPELYVDPLTGATSFTIARVFQLPSCRGVTVQLTGVTGIVIPLLGGVTFSPYE